MKIFLSLILLLGLCAFIPNRAFAQTPTPDWIKKIPDVQNANQVVVVAGTGETTAWISMHEKNSAGEFEQIMTTPGFIGKNGLGKEKEGDNKTPVGVFRFDKAFGIKPDPGCAIPYVKVTENLYWSGDANYKYNRLVDIRDYPELDKPDSEHLIDFNPHYNYALNISYNSACIAGKGSAIFMHCFGPAKPWTGGCVALPEEKMLFVMKHVKPGCVVIIDSIENLGGSI